MSIKIKEVLGKISRLDQSTQLMDKTLELLEDSTSRSTILNIKDKLNSQKLALQKEATISKLSQLNNLLYQTLEHLEDVDSRKEICNIIKQINSQKLTFFGVNSEKISLLEKELLLNYADKHVLYHQICQQTGVLLLQGPRIAFLVSNTGKVHGNCGRLNLIGHSFHSICLCGPNCGYFTEQTDLAYEEYIQKYLSVCKTLLYCCVDKIIYRKPLREKNPFQEEEDIEDFSWQFSKYTQMTKSFPFSV